MQLQCEIEEYWRIFHDVIAENGPFFFIPQTNCHTLINQEMLMCSSCVNLKQIVMAFMIIWLMIKQINLSKLQLFDSCHRFRFSNSTQIFSKETST